MAEHNMEDYEETRASFSIDVPEAFNFGYDVIDAWARKDRNRLAMIWVDQKGNEKKFTFRDMMNLSNQDGKYPSQIRHRLGRPVLPSFHGSVDW